MTIFDVIRYPVSTPPTEEELAAIPTDIYKAWVTWLGATGPNVSHPRIVALYLTGYHQVPTLLKLAVEDLKQRIRDME